MSRETTRVRRTRNRRPSMPTPLAFGLSEAAQLLGIGRTKLSELVATGELESFTIGRRRLVASDSLQAYVETQRRQQSKRVR